MASWKFYHDMPTWRHDLTKGSSQSSPSNESPVLAENLAEEVPNLNSDVTVKYAERLNTNYIPSSDEIMEIKQYASQINGRANEIDEEITRLEEQLMKLKTKHTMLQQAAAPYVAMASPFRRFPPELLQCIFAWCLPHARNAVMHCTEAPVLLGRVCSEWRRISLNTPEIWSSLHIVPPNYTSDNLAVNAARFQRKRDLVQMWLERSGACPLSMSFVWFGGEGDEEMRLCGTLLEVLIPLSKRWRQLDFQVPLKMLKPFVGLTRDNVPLLEGLSLTDNRSSFEVATIDQWPDSLIFAGSAARLRKFTLTFFSGGIQLPPILWDQLTVLYLESNISFFFRDCDQMLSTLEICQNLESCTLKFPLSHTTTLPPYEKINKVITLPNLLFLCIDGDQNLPNTFHMGSTLANLRCPKLKTMEIFGRTGRPEGIDAPEPLYSIRSLIEQSKCPLEKLKLESIALIEGELMACLRLVPTITELVVRDYGSRMGFARKEEANAIVENQILMALTVGKGKSAIGTRGCVDAVVGAGADGVGGGEPSALVAAGDVVDDGDEMEVLCPALTDFDFALCDASQELFCDFLESRWSVDDGDPDDCEKSKEGEEDGKHQVAKLKSVKCNFTAHENQAVKARLKKMKDEGLDATVVFHLPMPDEMNPSPWTGVEGL